MPFFIFNERTITKDPLMTKNNEKCKQGKFWCPTLPIKNNTRKSYQNVQISFLTQLKKVGKLFTAKVHLTWKDYISQQSSI